MGIFRAFTYVFNDPKWREKLAETGVFSVLCPAPVMGLLPLSALLGYMVDIIQNILHNDPEPLPLWDHIGEDVNRGFHVLIAFISYHVPPVIALILFYVFRAELKTLPNEVSVAILLLLLLYLFLAWSMLVIGLVRFAETWETGDFFRFSLILRTLRNNAALTLQWLLCAIAATIVLVLLTPLLLLGVALFIPVHGYLVGQFGLRLRAAKLAYPRPAH